MQRQAEPGAAGLTRNANGDRLMSVHATNRLVTCSVRSRLVSGGQQSQRIRRAALSLNRLVFVVIVYSKPQLFIVPASLNSYLNNNCIPYACNSVGAS